MMLRSLPAACALLVSAAVGLSARSASAQSTEASCDAVARTEPMRAAGQYRHSRTLLLQCVNAACGGDVRRRCAAELQRLDAVTPSIVVRALDASGNDVTDVALRLGEERLASSLDGMAIPVDPGSHRLVLQRAGHEPVSLDVVIREGEKFRSLEVTLEPPAPAPALEASEASASSSRFDPRIAAGASLIGVGVAGLAAFTWLGLKARSREEALGACKPGCTEARVDEVEKRYLLANISLGVGVVALGSATWLLLAGPSSEVAHEPALAGLSVLAGSDGAFASYSHRF